MMLKRRKLLVILVFPAIALIFLFGWLLTCIKEEVKE
jgi:hypothetical protein